MSSTPWPPFSPALDACVAAFVRARVCDGSTVKVLVLCAPAGAGVSRALARAFATYRVNATILDAGSAPAARRARLEAFVAAAGSRAPVALVLDHAEAFEAAAATAAKQVLAGRGGMLVVTATEECAATRFPSAVGVVRAGIKPVAAPALSAYLHANMPSASLAVTDAIAASALGNVAHARILLEWHVRGCRACVPTHAFELASGEAHTPSADATLLRACEFAAPAPSAAAAAAARVDGADAPVDNFGQARALLRGDVQQRGSIEAAPVSALVASALPSCFLRASSASALAALAATYDVLLETDALEAMCGRDPSLRVNIESASRASFTALGLACGLAAEFAQPSAAEFSAQRRASAAENAALARWSMRERAHALWWQPAEVTDMEAAAYTAALCARAPSPHASGGDAATVFAEESRPEDAGSFDMRDTKRLEASQLPPPPPPPFATTWPAHTSARASLEWLERTSVRLARMHAAMQTDGARALALLGGAALEDRTELAGLFAPLVHGNARALALLERADVPGVGARVQDIAAMTRVSARLARSLARGTGRVRLPYDEYEAPKVVARAVAPVQQPAKRPRQAASSPSASESSDGARRPRRPDFRF